MPDDLAKLFDDLLSRSFQAAQAEQEFRSTMAQAAEEFGREQARVMNALTQQMGLSAALQELESLRDRQNRAVIEAFETASSAILAAGGETGRKGESSRRRSR